MEWGLLCSLLLLLLSGGAVSSGTEGELCRGWTYDEKDSAAAAFRCPRVRDGADAKFCCGTCSSLPYCCSSGEARLERQRCPRAGLQMASTTGGPPPTARPPSEKRHWDSGPGFVFLTLTAVGMVLWAMAYYCKGRCCHHSNHDVNRGSVRLRILRRSPRRIIGAPACSVACSPPWYGAVDSGGNKDLPPLSPVVHVQSAAPGAMEKGCIDHPLVHRSVPGHALEPILEMEPSVDL